MPGGGGDGQVKLQTIKMLGEGWNQAVPVEPIFATIRHDMKPAILRIGFAAGTTAAAALELTPKEARRMAHDLIVMAHALDPQEKSE